MWLSFLPPTHSLISISFLPPTGYQMGWIGGGRLWLHFRVVGRPEGLGKETDLSNHDAARSIYAGLSPHWGYARTEYTGWDYPCRYLDCDIFLLHLTCSSIVSIWSWGSNDYFRHFLDAYQLGDKGKAVKQPTSHLSGSPLCLTIMI